MTELGRATQNDTWLILTDFASKHKISVSTLRRRIKNDQIKYKFEDGRYLIYDDAPSAVATSPVIAAPLVSTPQSDATEVKLKELGHEGASEEPILSSATRLLNELKRAYSSILHEKEEQMIQLKEEVSDLKTLVRVLESDNDRMRKILTQMAPKVPQTWV